MATQPSAIIDEIEATEILNKKRRLLILSPVVKYRRVTASRSAGEIAYQNFIFCFWINALTRWRMKSKSFRLIRTKFLKRSGLLERKIS